MYEFMKTCYLLDSVSGRGACSAKPVNIVLDYFSLICMYGYEIYGH